jgi:GTP cyclohydrolase IA
MSLDADGLEPFPGNLAAAPASKGSDEAKEARVDHCGCGADLIEAEPFERRSVAARPGRAQIEQAVRTLIAAAGDDPNREGLLETPARVARAYEEWFAGYAADPAALLDRTFADAEDYDDTILLRSIPLVSTCEHHLAPIVGQGHVAYRPNGRVVGISKLSRLVDAYARRLQLQERLTRQIARTLDEALAPRGVAVVIEATHGCMATRGVNQHGISMVTKCWLGDFRDDPELRREMMASIGCTSARIMS